MKKLLVVASLVAALSSSAAFAKTEGNYATFSVLRSSFSDKNKPANSDAKFKKDNAFGAQLDYKYAFNFNNFFVAPGVFAGKLGLESKNGYSSKAEINYLYGVKVDLGYDLTDNFAVYFTNGLSMIDFKAKCPDEDANGNLSLTSCGKSPVNSYFYGLGLGYNLNKQLALNLEYNIMKPSLKFKGSSEKLKTEIDMIKLGVSYRF